jgi:hypothetical protein
MAKQRKIKPRNPVARSPLLRKGGVHEKSRSSERSDTKRELEDKAADWEEEKKSPDEKSPDEKPPGDSDQES